HTVTIIPNIQSTFLSNNHISLLEYVDMEAVVWMKDVQFTFDVVRECYRKSSQFWKALSETEINNNPECIDPRVTFTDEPYFASLLVDFPVIEFGKQFVYKADRVIQFDTYPQPSFNKDFNLLIHNFKENEGKGIQNL